MVVKLTDPLFFFNAFRFCSSWAASKQRGFGFGVYLTVSEAQAFIRGGSGEAMGAVFRSGTSAFLWFVLSITFASMAFDRTFSGGFGEVGVMLISFST